MELGAAATLPLAFAKLGDALASIEPPAEDGLTRLEVEVAMQLEPALWLAHQRVFPRVYFSNQDKSLRVAGVGAAQRISSAAAFNDAEWTAMNRAISGASPRLRFYGGMRFDSEAEQRSEWAAFGGSFFVLPLWELQARCHLDPAWRMQPPATPRHLFVAGV